MAMFLANDRRTPILLTRPITLIEAKLPTVTVSTDLIRCLVLSFIGIALLAGVPGCTHPVAEVQTVAFEEEAEPDPTFVVPANEEWISTGLNIREGQAITITAAGKIVAKCKDRWGQGSASEVTPAGTYFVNDGIANQQFPLPSGAHGPSPCFALIGRIGKTPAFFIGKGKSWIAKHSGQLYLGINDFDVKLNSGEFTAQVSQPRKIQPIAHERVLDSDDQRGEPHPGSKAIVFYVDGLRPDVVREMAAMGHIPNIKRLFIDGGTWMSNAFTAFPSDTITSNGTMWTGCFSDRHGLKAQVRFSRRALASKSYLDPLGPSRSSRLLKPSGADGVVHKAQEFALKQARGSKAASTWKASQTTDVPPLYAHLQVNGSDWATGVLPMMTEMPPPLWTRSMTRHLPYMRAHEAWRYIDDANTTFAVRHLIEQQQPVTIIWLPETDSVSHKMCRGQFGMTRRTIAHADLMIGRIAAEIEARGRLNSTYFMLVSDHGHHGGRLSHLKHFDIANELVHRQRQVTRSGQWVGGGLGMSARQHRSWNRHRGDTAKQFMFIDGDTDGAARIFVPKGDYRSNDWSGPNRAADLISYQVAEHLPNVNLVDVFANCQVSDGAGNIERPIGLVLMKLNDESILVATADRGQAVIERQRADNGRYIYRYQVINNLRVENNEVAYSVDEHPEVDPLELLTHLHHESLKHFHNEAEWLKATSRTKYPDSVVALTRHMLWQENIRDREAEYAPDLVVTARTGWYFGGKASPGTMHGYPFADAMRASMFVSGPNIRRAARIEAPCRLADLTPTLLDMVGALPDDYQFDGVPLRNIYRSHDEQSSINRLANGKGTSALPTLWQPVSYSASQIDRAIYWKDVDLQAWRALDYQPLREYENKPFSIHNPNSPFDMNNITYNLMSVTDISVFRLFDDISSPLQNRDYMVTRAIEGVEVKARQQTPFVREIEDALDVSDLAVGDYSVTSMGNLQRIDGLINLVQERGKWLDRNVAGAFGREHTPGSKQIHKVIDGAQFGFWQTYLFGQRLIMEVVDEKIISGIENQTAGAVNSFRRTPAEVIVDE